MFKVSDNIPANLSVPAIPAETINIAFQDHGAPPPAHGQCNAILPFAAPGSLLMSSNIVDGRQLTDPESTRPIFDFWINVPNTDTIRPGDTVAIFPCNADATVQLIIEKQGWAENADKVFRVEYLATCKKKKTLMQFLPESSTIRNMLTEVLDIEKAPHKLLLLSMLNYVEDHEQQQGIRALCSKEMMSVYNREIMEKRISIRDVLIDSGIQIPFQVLLEHSSRLLPRPYSIISAPSKHTHKIRLAFSWDSTGPGLTTTMLKDRILNETNQPVYFYLRQSSSFCLEEKDTDKVLVMIGPGLGVIPFISMLEEVNDKYQKKLIITTWRNQGRDDVFLKELRDLKAQVHFSYTRDGGEKTYVQDLILKSELKEQLSEFLTEGGDLMKIFICGESKVMIPQIEAALIKCIEEKFSIPEADAQIKLKTLKDCKSIVTEQWF